MKRFRINKKLFFTATVLLIFASATPPSHCVGIPTDVSCCCAAMIWVAGGLLQKHWAASSGKAVSHKDRTDVPEADRIDLQYIAAGAEKTSKWEAAACGLFADQLMRRRGKTSSTLGNKDK